ncbi:MAG: efflux RND transporter permease subunit [Gammaproteobacteria bacterium]|nr:efflux RND transporter permease subunit [Gammaproteobacteria bacterium]
MWITKTSIGQPVFATMIMLGLLVLGLFSYQRLPVEQMPDVANPVVSITVEYPGASPEALENDVVKPIENVVNTVDGVHRIYSTMREGIAFVQIEFRLDVSIAAATQEVRDKVAQIRPSFPREVKDPQITRTNNDSNQQPVIEMAVYSPGRSLREVSTLTDQIIVKRLQNAPGVGNVVASGEAVRQIQIFLRPAQLQAYRIGVDQVIAAIQAANQDLPAGTISFGPSEQLVRVEGRIKDPRAFGRIIVGTQGDAVYLQQGGVPVHLDQVADVVDGEAEETSIARVDGRRAVGLQIFKIQNANVVQVGDGIQKALEELKGRLPADVHIVTIWSNADWIKGSLERVKETIVEGALLTVFIVFLFLHSWRSTVITGLTLPISVLATFIALNAFGFTLNFITLLALSLCIGLLIDDAIVVRENIVRHLAMGEGSCFATTGRGDSERPAKEGRAGSSESHQGRAMDGGYGAYENHKQAVLEATEEIGLAVMATTFAILAVFVPVAFMSGIIGRYFFQFGITVAVAVLVSLFVSFTLDPMLSSVWRDPVEGRFKHLPWLGRVMQRIERGVEWLHRGYARLLEWALSDRRHRWYVPIFGIVHAIRRRDWRQLGTLSHRGIVLWTAAGLFFGSFLLLPFIGTEFMPQTDDGFISLRLNTPIGSSLEYTDAKAHQVEQALKSFPEIVTISTTVGTDEGKNYARINLRLSDIETAHRRSQKQIEQAIRARLTSIAGIKLSVGWDKPIFISILGPDAAKLSLISRELMQKMAKIPGIADLESSETGDNPTIAVRVNDELASDLGLNVAAIGNALRPLIAGDQIGHWLGADGQDYDVVVRLPRGDRRLVSDLGDLYLSGTRLNADGTPMLVPLRQVAGFVETKTPQQIKRQNLQRRVSLYANAVGRAAGDVGADVSKLLAQTRLPPGYRFDVGGQQEDMNESFKAALAALGLAVIFIYLILASQFGSFLQPVAIMASLPLSLAGVFLALLVTRTTLNLFSMIGFIMLMGLVTKNAILLVDFANRGIRSGQPLRRALLDAGQVRLRPILMTTLAMIFGMLPLAIGYGQGGELQAPMGRAVIGGLLTSTLLTLVVVPVLYTYLHAFGERARRWFGAGVEAAGAGTEAPATDG